MWILEWIPFWIFDVALIIGIIGFIVTYLLRFIPIPSLYLYKSPIQILSVLIIIISVYMLGSIANEEAWKLKIAEYEVKIAEARAESEKVNVQIVEKIVTKTKVIKEQNKDVIQFVDREVIKYDSKCEIPSEVIDALNMAAERNKK